MNPNLSRPELLPRFLGLLLTSVARAYKHGDLDEDDLEMLRTAIESEEATPRDVMDFVLARAGER